ncbi:18419_t:CDS:1, partial [Funneliformis geosporum]
ATQKLSLLKSDNKNKIITYFSPMNLDDDEFNDLCKGFETWNLNEGKENSMEIDEKVKLDENHKLWVKK